MRCSKTQKKQDENQFIIKKMKSHQSVCQCHDWPSLLWRACGVWTEIRKKGCFCGAASSYDMTWHWSITWMRAACLWWMPNFQNVCCYWPKSSWVYPYIVLLPFIIPYLVLTFSWPCVQRQNPQRCNISLFAQTSVKHKTVSALQRWASVKLIIHRKVASYKGYIASWAMWALGRGQSCQ